MAWPEWMTRRMTQVETRPTVIRQGMLIFGSQKKHCAFLLSAVTSH